MSVLALSACASHGGSRYGDVQAGPPPVPCGTVTLPCAPVIEYYPVRVQPQPYPVPAPCPIGQCPATIEAPMVNKPPIAVKPAPIITEPPTIVEPSYTPPSLALPEPPERSITSSWPVVDDPVVTCPEGTIPSYGGQECIPITVPRK